MDAPSRAVICIAQMAGGILAALLADAMTPGTLSLNVGLDKGTNRTQGLFLEAFASFILTMAVLMIAAGEPFELLAEPLSSQLSHYLTRGRKPSRRYAGPVTVPRTCITTH